MISNEKDVGGERVEWGKRGGEGRKRGVLCSSFYLTNLGLSWAPSFLSFLRLCFSFPSLKLVPDGGSEGYSRDATISVTIGSLRIKPNLAE